MLVTGEGPPDKRAGDPTSSKVIQVILIMAMQSLGPGPYLGRFDWGGGCVPCGRRPQRGEVCGRGMCPLLHKVRKLKYTSIL